MHICTSKKILSDSLITYWCITDYFIMWGSCSQFYFPRICTSYMFSIMGFHHRSHEYEQCNKKLNRWIFKSDAILLDKNSFSYLLLLNWFVLSNVIDSSNYYGRFWYCFTMWCFDWNENSLPIIFQIIFKHSN